MSNNQVLKEPRLNRESLKTNLSRIVEVNKTLDKMYKEDEARNKE